jgi:hypothetical protein
VRASTWFLVAALAGCKPSAIVERTMPVASLRAYRTVALRVKSTAFAAQGQATLLEMSLSQRLRGQCSFQQVAAGAPADVVLDLNITNMLRGGDGWVRNNSQAIVETLLVLSDGQSGDLLGTARIRGKSSGMIINSGLPENEAVQAVAKSVGDLLAQSGCGGPRIARAEPAPPVPAVTDGSAAPPPDDKHRADAEALNEAGKEKLRGADVPGAVAAFQQAIALVPDPRYFYNLCIAHEAGEKWADAIAACSQARSLNPEPRLVAKIDARLDVLKQRR